MISQYNFVPESTAVMIIVGIISLSTHYHQTTSFHHSVANPMMSLHSSIFLMLQLFNTLPVCFGQWVQYTDPSLPRADEYMAAGHYNGSIYLLYVLRLHVFRLCHSFKMHYIRLGEIWSHCSPNLTATIVDSDIAFRELWPC